MRFISPVSTWPGPTSTKVSTPWPIIHCTDSVQRTGAVSCCTNSSAISPTAASGLAVTLPTTGTLGARNTVASTAWRKEATAGAMSGEWAAMLTANRTTFRAPAALARSIASVRATSSPEMTICPGAL